MTFISDNRQIQGINRTICIGLGGTGRDILMRIRRLIVDRYGDFKNLPIVSFVHIDTDKAATRVVGLSTGSTYHGVDLRFDISEKVAATMTSTEVTNFIHGLENRTIYDREGPFDHIGCWFPPQLLRNITAIEEGAKGIRPVGRLAFFHNYSVIQEAIQKAERRTRGHEQTIMKTTGLMVEPGLEIFIVGSLCGGTGSGMFLDVAYSLRRTYGDQGNEGIQIVGYFVISPELYGNTPNMKANTYAALKELNYYTTTGTRFEFCYDQNNLVFVTEDRPPFHYTYLVSSQTTGEYAIFDQRKLCNVIAHKIALDFSGELSPVIKGMRDNFTQHLGQWDKHPRPNIQRYLTFGLASIYFPRDTVFQISLSQISRNLVMFWLNGEGQSPDPQRLLEQFLRQYQWHNDGEARDGLLAKLEGTVQESNKSFKQTLTVWKSRLDETIADCKTKDDREDMQRQLQRAFQDQFRTKVQPGEMESVRGVWLTRLQQENPRLTQKLRGEIDEYLEYLLTPETRDFSIKSVREWLAALTTELNQYQLSLDEKIKDFNGYKQPEDLDRVWRNGQREIDEIEQEFAIPVVGKKRKNRNVQEKARTIVGKIAEIIQHNFDLGVAQETIKVVRELQGHVQNRSTQVSSLRNLLEILRSEFQTEEKEVKQFNFDEMSGEAIFDETDLADFGNTLIPSDQLRSQLEVVSSEITNHKGRGKSLAIFLARERVTKEQLQGKINLTVDRLFGSRSRNMVNSVIKSFMQNYSSSQCSIRFQQILAEAEPLLPLNLSDPYYYDAPSKKSEIIGFKEVDEQEIKQFKTLLTRDLGISENVLKPTQSEDEILIVKEYAGFPLRLIKSLESLRNSYWREKSYPYTFLHTDRNEPFSDIIPLPAREIEELEDLFYPSLAFDLIEEVSIQDSDTQRTIQKLQVNFFDERTGEPYPIFISPIWQQALETIADRADIKQEIKAQLERQIDKITTQQIWETNYLPKLQDFEKKVEQLPEDDPNYNYRETVIGARGTATTPAKQGIISRFYKRMLDRIKKKKEEQHFLEQRNQEALPPEAENQPSTSVNNDSETLDAEIEENNSVGNTPDNKTTMDEEIEKLNQRYKNGEFKTPQEFESERQEIIKKYSSES